MPERVYSASYRARVERVLKMTIEEAKAQGLSLQRARGHSPREKAILDERRRERGDLTDRQRQFLRSQVGRSKGAEEAWEEAEDTFREMDSAERDAHIREQQRLARGYRRKVGGERRGSNPLRSGRRGFVAPHLDMGLQLSDFDFAMLPMLFYH